MSLSSLWACSLVPVSGLIASLNGLYHTPTYRGGAISNFLVYASHKHTKEFGGSQDNQYHDLIEFVNHVVQNEDEDTLFLAIADGYYYEANDSAKLKYLDRVASESPRCAACQSDTLIDRLEELIAEIEEEED